jgi:type IV pilus assembly protein PilM
MLNLLRKKVFPIGIDLGSFSLKIIQLARVAGKLELIAAAKAEVPKDVRGDLLGLQKWYITNIKELLTAKPFKGKRAVSCMPAHTMLIQHLRLPKMEEKQLEQALMWEAQEKLPFDVAGALIRHITVGEVYENDQAKQEVILMAASRNVVQQHLHLVEQSKIEIDCINVEACALVNGFSHLDGRSDQQNHAMMLVDLGHSCTKVVAAHGSKMVFCRTINLGAQIWNDVSPNASFVAKTKSTNALQESGASRVTVIEEESQGEESQVVGNEPTLKSTAQPVLQNLVTEVLSCIRYHDLMFDNQPVEKVIFVGGKAKDRQLCQRLAQGLGLPAQLGDPLARIEASSRTGSHSDLDDQQINPDWAVAFGLCLGGHGQEIKS